MFFQNHTSHSGAQQADVAILVISARRGEFEAGFDRGGQTREHGLLAKTLGISRVVVVVNKMDTCEWGKDRYDEIQTRVQNFYVMISVLKRNMFHFYRFQVKMQQILNYLYLKIYVHGMMV